MAYATTAEFQNRYGQGNLRKWADMEGTGYAANSTNIDARIAEALTVATARIDDRLRRSDLQFSIPLSGTIPTTIMHICRRIAGYELSIARGVTQYDQDGNPMTPLFADYRAALEELEMVADGKLKPSWS